MAASSTASPDQELPHTTNEDERARCMAPTFYQVRRLLRRATTALPIRGTANGSAFFAR